MNDETKYPEIKFEDIRAGDTISATYTHENLTTTSIGVVGKILGDSAYTENALMIAYRDSGSTLRLIDRPKPQLPEAPGSLIFASRARGVDYFGAHAAPPGWLMMLVPEGCWLSEREIDGRSAHLPKHIEPWVPAKAVQA